MAGRLSFSIAINLLTENFKKGSNQVKAAFRSMQMQILTFAAALGAGGIGLSNLVSRFIDVARETNRVTTALKNVSGGMAQFAENQRFLLEMAKKYGLEINALTGSYAKFTAAASISGMSMMDQRKIFESVSRAVTAFGMSADDSNGVFLALSQMMSKGKISSEELRLQMGERLPIALQAMAKAAGTSVAGLDKLLKQGKLMSADVLPKFADALNEMIPNVDTDNLETSVNRLKNTFTELVNSFDVQGKYKSLVDGLGEVLRTVQSKISGLVAFIITLLSGKLLKSVITYFSRYWKEIDTTVNKAKVAEEQKLLFTQKRIDAEKKYESTKTAYETVENGKRQASAAQLRKAKGALERAQLAEKKAVEAEKTAAERASAVKSTSLWGKTANTIKLGFAGIAMSLKSLWAAVWPMALITAIGAVIGKLVDMHKEAKRIKNIFADYKKESQLSGYTEEVVVLKQQLKIMNDKQQSQDNINSAQAQLQKMLGVEHKSQEELNKLVAKRVELLKETARADFHARKIVESEDISKRIGDKTYNGKTIREMAPAWAASRGDRKKEEAFKQKYGITSGIDELKFKFSDFKNDLNSFIENAKILKHSKAELEKSQIATNQIINKSDLTLDPPDSEQTELQKMEDKYAQSLRELNARKEVEKMTTDEYNKAYDQLNRNALIEAKSSSDKQVLESEYLKNLQKLVSSPAYTNTKEHEELLKVEAEYNKATEIAKSKLDRKLITEDEYRRALIDAAVAAANSAISIENIGNAADGFIKRMQNVVGDNLKIEMPKLGKRDTTFDYKKTDADKKSEELDIWVKYKDDLKEKLEEARKAGSDTAKSLELEFNNAIANVNNLEDALKLAQVQEDVKNFSKELSESMYSGIKDIASSSDRVVSAFRNLGDVLVDVDATEWEKIMALWSAMTNVVDSFMSIIKMIESLTELTNKLSQAKKRETLMTNEAATSKLTEAAVDTTVTGVKVTNSKIKQTADSAEANTAATTAGVEVAANTAKGVSAAGASAASLPFPANIIAIGAAIAAAVALFASIPKFAKGGIIGGGPTSGDKLLARVNAGEMILNQGQQSNLFNAINSGRLGRSAGNLSSTVSTRVRAKDIILTINNELKSQGKKPIS